MNRLKKGKIQLVGSYLWLVVPFLFLTFITFLLLKFGMSGVYYSIDPDIVYLSNALLYIKSGILAYYDHPGTPAITLLATSMAPLRIYVKYFLESNFLSWAFSNFDALVLYSRLVQLVIFTSSLYIFGTAVYTATKSRIAQTTSLLMLFGFKPVYYASISISAEPTMMFFSSLYLLFLSVFYKSKKIQFGYILLFLSGLMFSNRATTFFYIPLSLFVFIYHLKVRLNLDNFRSVAKLLMLAIVGFLLGSYPLKSLFMPMVYRILYFAKSGQIHGGGGFLNIHDYSNSLVSFLYTDTFASVVFLITVFIFIKNLKLKNYIVLIISGAAIVGTLVVAKLPLSHYQVPNYMLLVFALSLEFAKLDIYRKIFLLLITTLCVSNVYFIFNKEFNQTVRNAVNLSNFADKNISKKATVWEWARTESFSKLWIRDKSGGIFNDELTTANIYELSEDLTKVRISPLNLVSLSDFCWDQLYIQKVSLGRFLDSNKHMDLQYINTVDSDNMVLIKSKHCLK